jgi:hypothetical protein
MVRARFKRFKKSANAKGLNAEEIAAAFIAQNREWLRSHRINPGQYTSLKNDLSTGKQEKKKARERRVAHGVYLRAATAHALGLPGGVPGLASFSWPRNSVTIPETR